jgi:hypothetical protein
MSIRGYKSQNMKRNTRVFLQPHIALPTDHGSWVFLLSPLLIGLFAGKSFSLDSILLILAALAAFLVRQPVTVLVKVLSKRRGRQDLPPALFWAGVYGLIGLLAFTALALRGFGYLFWLAAPGAPVFLWHLVLVSRRQERRQAGVEIVASGVLALAAPAAYWVGVRSPHPAGWWLLGLIWLQSAASIVYAYLRLAQRELKAVPERPVQISMARRALAYTTFNFVFVLILSMQSILPQFLFLPYLLQWLETLWGTLNPAVGVKPTRIGIRQLIVSSLFTVLFILTWSI